MSNLFTLEFCGSARLNPELIERLGTALDQAEDRGPGTVFLLSIHGHEFDADLIQWPGEAQIAHVNNWERVLRRIERAPLPVIAIAEHACSAMALELLTVADRRIATSTFSLHPENVGGVVWPGMSLFRLVRQIGEARTRRLFLDEGIVTAEGALSLDLVDEIVPHKAAGLERASVLASEAPLHDFAVLRRLMQDSHSMSYEDALGAHLAACHRALRARGAGES